MRDTVALLLELQELEIVLQESRIVHRTQSPGAQADVEATVAALRARVPDGILKRFDGMRRNGQAVAREIDGVCGACRLNVPVGDLNRMRAGRMPCACPNCGRFLLLAERPERTGS